MKSSQVLLLEEKIKTLERQLYLLGGIEKISNYFSEEAVELDCQISTIIQIPLYFHGKFDLEKYKLQFKAYIKGFNEFAYYCDNVNLSVYEEAKIFDDIIEKITDQFTQYLIQKRKQHESL